MEQYQRLLREAEEEKKRNRGPLRVSEISYSADKERLLERIRVLEVVLREKDQALTQQRVNLSLVNEELEKERASVSRLQNEIEKAREANSLLPVLHSDLRRLQSELQDTQAVGEEQQARQRLEEELPQSRRTCAEVERSLENERLLIQSNQQAAQTRDETIRKQALQLKQERRWAESRLRGDGTRLTSRNRGIVNRTGTVITRIRAALD